MTRLETVQARLDQAVERLERLAEVRGDSGMEQAKIQETLATIRDDYQALRKITQTARTRLDETIGRLEGILES